MGVELVFRSNHPAVRAHLAECDKQREEFHEAADAFAAEVGDGWEALRLQTWRSFVAGIKARDELTPAGPWRFTVRETLGGTYSVWVPDKRKKGGRALAERMEALRLSLPTAKLPGMPDEWWSLDNHVYHAGCHVRDDFVWVIWGTQAMLHATGKEMFDWKLDESIWQRAPLSEYYAMVEAEKTATS